MLKACPWWLFWLPSGFWITLSPHIYHPRNVDPTGFPEVLAHEQVHLRQQAAGNRWVWFLRYVLSRRFRLAMECEAIAVELEMLRGTPPNAWLRCFQGYTQALSSWPYLWAARNEDHAAGAMDRAIHQRALA